MTEPIASASTAPAPDEKASIWEDFIDIFGSPARVFRRREFGSWFIPMVIVTIALTVLAFTNAGVLRPVYDAEFQRQAATVMQKNPQVTEEMLQKGRAFGEIAQRFGTIVVTPIMILVVGFITWLVGKLVDSRQELHAALVVAAYAMVPRILQSIAYGVEGLVMKPDQLTSLSGITFSAARFLNPDSTSPVLIAALSRVDLFTIWVTVLLGIGLYVTGRISKVRASIAAVIIWIIGGLPALLGGLRQA